MKKKLLFINGHMGIGGVETSLIDLLNSIDYSVYEVDLLLLEELGVHATSLPKDVNIIHKDWSHAYGPFFKTLASNLVHLRFKEILFRIILIMVSGLSKKAFVFLRRLLGLKKKYDCAIAYRQGICCEIVAYAINSDKKLCWWHNGENCYDDRAIEYINDQWQKIDNIVAVSSGCKKMIEEIFDVAPEKVTIIPNIINIEKITRLAEEKTPFEKEVLNFVTIGRLCPEKHIEDVPILAKMLVEDGVKNFQWHIIGDGENRKSIEKLIKERGVEKFVIMHGGQSNPYPFIKNADILVHTSRIEAQCTTLLEAMALQTPVVTTETFLPQDFTIDGENCIICKQNHESQLQGIKRMIEILPNSKGMVENARKSVEELYSRKRIITLFDKFVG